MVRFHKSTAIRFENLSEDEQLLVSIYRDWRRFGTTVEQSEYNLGQLLRDDPIAAALPVLFAFFKASVSPCCDEDYDADWLCFSEERLLRLLAGDDLVRKNYMAQRCRATLQAVPLHLRTPDQIRPKRRLVRFGFMTGFGATADFA